MISFFKFSTFFILSFCATHYSSAILAVQVNHTSEVPAQEFQKAIATFLKKRDAGPIEQILDDNDLFKAASEGSLYRVNFKDITNILKSYCPVGYLINQSNGVKEGQIFSNNEKVADFRLKKLASRANKYLPLEEKNFSAKIWQITLIHADGTEEFYLLFSSLKHI